MCGWLAGWLMAIDGWLPWMAGAPQALSRVVPAIKVAEDAVVLKSSAGSITLLPYAQ